MDGLGFLVVGKQRTPRVEVLAGGKVLPRNVAGRTAFVRVDDRRHGGYGDDGVHPHADGGGRKNQLLSRHVS